MTALKKVCPRAHYQVVLQDNGAAAYCRKEDTRVEGPWEFGEEVLHAYVSGDKAKAEQRAKKNEVIMSHPLHVLIDQGVIAAREAPVIARAKEIYNASLAAEKV